MDSYSSLINPFKSSTQKVSCANLYTYDGISWKRQVLERRFNVKDVVSQEASLALGYGRDYDSRVNVNNGRLPLHVGTPSK